MIMKTDELLVELHQIQHRLQTLKGYSEVS